MPDIAMCQQHKCALWMSCYRYRAVPGAYYDARKFSGKRIDLSRSLWNELSGGSKPGLVQGWARVEAGR